MKFSKLLQTSNVLLYILFFSMGILLCAYNPAIPKYVGILFIQQPQPPPPPPPLPPTVNEINEVLSGSLALVEAQHTYYVHVTHNTKFAENIREMGFVNGEKGGVVMVEQVWNASDAVSNPIPLHGYFFQCVSVARGPEIKDGLVVLAYPAKEAHWPLYLSIIPDVKGGLIGISAKETWEVNDAAAAKEIRALSQKGRLSMKDLEKYSPVHFPKNLLIENFKKQGQLEPPERNNADSPPPPGKDAPDSNVK
jgi:hypothetical protein